MKVNMENVIKAFEILYPQEFQRVLAVLALGEKKEEDADEG